MDWAIIAESTRTIPTPPAIKAARIATQIYSPKTTSRVPIGVVNIALKTDSNVMRT